MIGETFAKYSSSNNYREDFKFFFRTNGFSEILTCGMVYVFFDLEKAYNAAWKYGI